MASQLVIVVLRKNSSGPNMKKTRILLCSSRVTIQAVLGFSPF